MWKASGNKGFEALVDNLYDCAQYLASQVNEREGFTLVLPQVLVSSLNYSASIL